jgi:hypothetical protein
MIGGDATLFRVISFPFLPISAGGGSGVIEIRFTPAGRMGTFRALLRIFSNDPITQPLLVEVVAQVAYDSTLVAWWPLDGDGADASGNGFDGTLVGNPATSPGANHFTGGALEFDGASTRIEVPFAAELNPDDFTVTLWANPSAAAPGMNGSLISNRDQAPGAFTHGFALNNSVGNWDFWTGDGDPGWDILTGAAVASGTWSHLAISYDSSTGTKNFYVDGELAATDDTPQSGSSQYVKNGTIEAEDLHIGAGQDEWLGDWFHGGIDDVALFRTALTGLEIQAIMHRGVARFVEEDRLFQLTEIRAGSEPARITLTWNSEADALYAIDRSTDLSTTWEEIEDSEPSGGAVTSYTDLAVPPGASRVFYRVRVPGD